MLVLMEVDEGSVRICEMLEQEGHVYFGLNTPWQLLKEAVVFFSRDRQVSVVFPFVLEKHLHFFN